MDFLQPTSLDEALAMKAERPEATPIQGGTDLMVDINFDRARPEATLDLNRVPELHELTQEDGHVWVGAGMPYLRILRELQEDAPGLCMAARTVGSPQIRARGTLGGNLGTASPAGDTLPVLVAIGATAEVSSSARGCREIAVRDFIVRPRHSALEPDELIVRVRVPKARGPQQFGKVGQRNAMVISIASFGLAFDLDARTVGTGIGSAGPVILDAPEAHAYVGETFMTEGLWESAGPLPDGTAKRFGELVGEAASPIDDVRGTARYRRHALSVVAARSLKWAWDEHRATSGATS
ncbi:MAG: molybdopterin dehydrogenase FAD-binding protein [Thermoleophilia bacterium]|nr:molybdopterin dehydrogenase FAD-binding protein [Thermoleophilia bacterium]